MMVGSRGSAITCVLFSLIAVGSAFHVPTTSRKSCRDSVKLFESTLEFTTKAPVEEIQRRRNMVIISHPDSGKTTMTEKLLLYGGALQQAGAVRQKAEQRATQSDFMVRLPYRSDISVVGRYI